MAITGQEPTVEEPGLVEITPRQRGRASLQFAADLARAINQTNREVRGWLEERGLSDATLAPDPEQRLEQVASELHDCELYVASTLCADWLWENHGRISLAGFDELPAAAQAGLDALDDGPTTLTTKAEFNCPRYHSQQWFHRTTGGWEGHQYMGVIQSEFVHKRYVTAKYGANIYNLREQVLEVLPDAGFKQILELGTSAGYFTRVIADRFPDAQITGCDLSRKMLEQARRVGNERGAAWQLWQAPAEDTGFASESFDLVTSYALFHELPGEVIAQVWQEAFRLLRPGGYALMVDGIAHFDDVDRLSSWRSLHDWRRGGEPYAHHYAQLDDAAIAVEAGFVDVTHKTLSSEQPLPRYTLAHKPAASESV